MSAQVKPGYKLTEVGVIPDDWDTSRLSDLAELTSSKRIFEHDYVPTGIPFYRGKEISLLISRKAIEDPYFISEEKFNEIKQQFGAPKIGDILITAVGTLGNIFVVNSEVKFYFKDGNLIWLKCINSADSNYVGAQLNKYKSKILEGAIGSSQKALTIVVLRELQIPVAPLLEQRAIAAALSDMDALISGLDQLIAKKHDIKKAAMQQLLTGQQRLPGFSSPIQRFKNTQVGRIPEDWKIARLGDLVDPSRSIRYGIVQPGRYDPQGRYMLRGQDYSEAKGWANPSEVFRVSPAVEERYRNARLKTGDLIMTIVGYCGHVEVIPAWLDGANLTQTTVRIAIEPTKAISAYCKYVLLGFAGKNQVSAYMKGAAQPGLNCGDIEQFFLPMPTISEQAAIAAILSDMDSELVVLETRRDKARQLKQGMMQELLTGKIRIS